MNYIGYQKKNTPIATQSPTLRDLEWAAGFCEGEACFGWNGSTERVALAQADNLDVLEKMQKLFGGTLTNKLIPNKNLPNARPQKVWSVTGSRARGFMMTIYYLMGNRRKEQIKKALRQGSND